VRLHDVREVEKVSEIEGERSCKAVRLRLQFSQVKVEGGNEK
jgi:hypothetical protein